MDDIQNSRALEAKFQTCRSRFSRSGSFPSSAESSGPLREAALCASEMPRLGWAGGKDVTPLTRWEQPTGCENPHRLPS